ncbi:copper resistance system multicopper oxidase [Piscinibacter koreensis]|uniref:Copper resistance system multicopper oxidase n=1 Tax=Piscinibacter koreensis TaxID=2742824 RepID=A0A7Y6NSD2_9BURK|nr:copper resistance system multicopper oxidase [Schlegelella koreensis]NUZ08445.1 copper resistance system multicopper oxidase [Schlegelella koreensis]
MDEIKHDRGRRRFVQSAAALGVLDAFGALAPAYAQTARGGNTEIRVGGDRVADLVIAPTPIEFGGRSGSAVTINGTVPGPILRFREGETATLRVTNRLTHDTSVHWHGLLVPSDMDGVPGVSFPGIRPGETFTYRYRVRQNGTYWYHSHSALQEQLGHYAPIVIEPAGRDPVAFDREHVVMLSDWTFRDPERAIAKLKKEGGYFNYQQRTLGDFVKDVREMGWSGAVKDRAMWAKMRMDPTDILDVTGSTYTYLMNGLPAAGNWTGLVRSGERVRLRFINGSSQTYFNVRIPGLPMTIVQADGQNVQPVTVDEFQIATAETYDVIVQPQAEQAYTVFAESMDRSGYVRGTLATRPGLAAPVPALRKRPLRNMVDMGMDMESMDMPGMSHGAKPMAMDAGSMQGMAAMDHGSMQGMPGMDHGAQPPGSMPGMDMGAGAAKPMPGMDMGKGKEADAMQQMAGMGKGADKSMPGMKMEGMESMAGMDSPINGKHGPDNHGRGNTMTAMVQRNRLGEPGTGLADVGHRVLVYNDLKALEPSRDPRPPQREIEMHLTGNMEAFIWGIDGKKFSESGPPPMVRVGERVRLTMVNDTMMEHPMHLHGVFMELNNTADPAHRPRKHTINVKPAERVSLDFTYDEPGNFAFHCHQLFHMEAGMFGFFNVSDPA